MQMWASTFTSEVFLFSSSAVSSQSFICASGQRLSFQDKTGDLSKQWCDEITALWKTSHSHLYAALDEESVRGSVAAWHFASPSSPFCLKNARIRRQKSRFIPPSPSLLQVSQLEPQLWKNSPQHSFLCFTIHFISFISELSWISPSRSSANLAKTSPGAGLVSRVSVTERSYLSWTAIISFSPCFEKRKDSCSLCHLTISVLQREWGRSTIESMKPPHLSNYVSLI